MAELKVELPKMGESVAEATITTWLKAVGDKIEEDEPIVDVRKIKIISHKDKGDWELIPKYHIGNS